MNLSEAIYKFDSEYRNQSLLPHSIVTVDGKFVDDIALRTAKGEPLEEYYKWQFIYALVNSGLYPKDVIGTEIYFPKGNIGSAPIKIDAVIFQDVTWIDDYRAYRKGKDPDALDRLRRAAVGVIEFKRDGKKIESVFNSQIKASLKEPDARFVLGAYYDERRLYLFKRIGNDLRRLDSNKNMPTSQRILERFQLEITDPYLVMPSHTELMKLNSGCGPGPAAGRKVEDLDVVYTVHDDRVKTALSRILRSLDRVSMVDEEGYMILIQLLAMKIFDEKQSETHGTLLRFYIMPDEHAFRKLTDKNVETYTERLATLYAEARVYYKNVLSVNRINWKNEAHVRVIADITNELQTFAFTRSPKSDLYQLVFYNFATAFKKDQNSQFLTPLPIISFLVDIINPRRNETVLDPCCGTGDFLSVSYVSAQSKLNDWNLYGTDNDRKMILLSELNMLLNGDGNANIRHTPEMGALTQKFAIDSTIATLDPERHKAGAWDTWPDETELMKFDVVLTNPPFGKGRSLDLSKLADSSAARLYKLHESYVVGSSGKEGLDLGVVFLENAVRSLKLGGRFGIVLSNSIASNKTWQFVRDWLLQNVRLVAVFDLPQDVFAETGVNTTLIVGYKPKVRTISQLLETNYAIFSREIGTVGYNKRISNRNTVFDPLYKLDPVTFETIVDMEGRSVLDEDFTETVKAFRQWCVSQEGELKKLFLEQ